MSIREKWHVLFLVCTTIMFSCEKRQANVVNNEIDDSLSELIEVNLDELQPVKRDLFTDVSFVVLKSNQGNFVGRIDKMISHGGMIIIMDKSQSAIIAFDSLGNELFDIRKEGFGPGEYPKLRDISVNKYSQCIEVIDLDRQRIISYSMKNGEFVSESSYDFYTSQSMVTTEKFRVFNNQNLPNGAFGGDASQNQMVYLTNEENEIVARYLDFFWRPDQSFSIPRFNMYRHSSDYNLINYIPLYRTDVVYGLTEDKVYERYRLTYGDHKTSYDLIKEFKGNNSVSFSTQLQDDQYVHSMTNFLESDDVLFFQFQKGLKSYSYLKKIGDNSSVVYNISLYDMNNLISAPIATSNGYFYSEISNEMLESMRSRMESKFDVSVYKESEIYKAIELAIEESERGNVSPLIMKYKFQF